jgi:hypothetical protein
MVKLSINGNGKVMTIETNDYLSLFPLINFIAETSKVNLHIHSEFSGGEVFDCYTRTNSTGNGIAYKAFAQCLGMYATKQLRESSTPADNG